MVKGRWRLAGVILLLLVQAALAAFLGFAALLHWKEIERFGPYRRPPHLPSAEKSLRVQLETAGMIGNAALGLGIGASVVLSFARLDASSTVRTAQRFSGWICLAAAGVMLLGALSVPRVDSPHNDMFPGLTFWASMIVTFLVAGAAFLIARLLRPSPF
jgi:hypothetical protein